MTNQKEKVSKARLVAFELLEQWRAGEVFADALLERAVSRRGLSAEDRALAQELFYGVFRRKLYLDHLIDAFARQGRRSLPEAVQDILRLSLYQLLYLTQVPDYAVIDEACRLCRSRVSESLVRVVNGVLRQAQRRREQLPEIPGPGGSAGYLSIKYSLPKWIVREFLDQFGFEETERLGQWAVSRPPLTLRVNLRRTTRQQLLEKLIEAGIEAHLHPDCATAVGVDSKGSLSQLPGYQEGLWLVQDASAQRVAPLLDVQPGDRVWDPCAAPGGKSLQVLEPLGQAGRLWVSDLSRRRLRPLVDNWRRLSDRPMLVWAGDLLNPPLCRDVVFDWILLDVPCSGLGVLSRRVDLRYRIKPKDIDRLADLQLGLLRQAAARLRAGGGIVYSTCTLMEKENRQVVERFLAECRDFRREPVDAKGDLLILPRTGVRDGVFAARLRKVAPGSLEQKRLD